MKFGAREKATVRLQSVVCVSSHTWALPLITYAAPACQCLVCTSKAVEHRLMKPI